MTAPTVWPALALSSHPLQRAGAWAVAVMAGRETPVGVSGPDLDGVAARIVDDVVAAACLPKSAASPDWWKVLFAQYPNAKPTHAQRSRDPAPMRASVSALFTADPDGAALVPCTFCAAPAGVVWAKMHLPMFDSTKAVNTLPPATVGWPVCRGCRVAIWALPYGAWLTAGSATVLMCASSVVERRFAARNVRRAGRIQQVGFGGVAADACAETITLLALRALAADAPVDAVLWSFKNDNQEPWLRVTVARQAAARLLARIDTQPALRLGWTRLRRALGRRDKAGHGNTAIARTLFDDEQRTSDRLIRALFAEFRDPPADPYVVDGWRRLGRAYHEEMYGMDVDRLVPARDLITDWITAERNPRGRFNEYAKAAGNAFELNRLLMQASARLLRDGTRPADVSGVTPALMSGGPDGWRLRAQLFFEVVAELVHRDAAIGAKPDPDTQPDDEPMLLDADEEGAYA
ncbi:hypothetical protein [Mangrovihabitans endophyticus]|uniref:CRISPR-associated protein Cst1 n=1 Tax=Mangrovihabitans endophyticus TaxID=1751298 RepID=A0A8J3FTD5_9ACTN|nr:hypothetical protein [Mangrovihabitans endophyticus]GGL19472.1 hypothetical protein GCM10012284_62500 [Mangrovihabitans endophyticus]